MNPSISSVQPARGTQMACLIVVLLAAVSVRGQNFTLHWFTLDGGGIQSTGGVYSASTSVGQPVTGVLSGGSYSGWGDFWSIAGVAQELNAPTLSVTNNAGTLIVAWEKIASDFVLEWTPSLSTPVISWSQVALPYQTNATQNFVSDPAPSGNSFYRLRKP